MSEKDIQVMLGAEVALKPYCQNSECIQVSQYGPDHCRAFDTGNDSDITTALIASFDINVIYTF